ncbi:MAG: dihydrolipoyl dehydrogenase [Magnetococcales bacterium]|nr:dihydrolipoyl dehydrogenase [Magnetococcales bacterium]MEC8066879.1 dihydrolipoyl dehydrogenase [Pseudomonadota bacterium]|tara:strand:+ start:33364 stop:34752 length:1389 start_codon:yes stop_codon:yes gene_type:complete
MSQFDLIVIGAGPAGYVSAIRAAQLGMKTALIEKRKELGGTCLNVGCIPSKALLDSSEKYEMAQHHFADHGIEVTDVKTDIPKMIKRKQSVVDKMTQGINFLMKKNKVTVINGWATIDGPNTVKVDDGDVYEAKKILIAAGSDVIELPFAKYDGEHIISSTEALELQTVPQHLIVIGAGVIGLELGSVWRRLGAKVSVIDIADKPLAVMDGDLGKEAQKLFTKQGLEFYMESKVTGVNVEDGNVNVELEDKNGETKKLNGDKVLVAVGRKPNTSGLKLENANIKTDDRGFIEVNENFQTSCESIYAVGDCAPGPMLAHKGEEEGVVCVEMMAGQKPHVNYDCIPWVVYTSPEISGVGKTEEMLKEEGVAYNVGKFNYLANGRAVAMAESTGFVKVLADKKTDKLLGVHMIGHNTSEMIHEAVAIMEFGGSAEDMARMVHAHPTMSEATKEAALAVDGRAIHA